MPESEDKPFVSRGGLKLAHALREFHVDPKGWTCADLGCSTGGFTDCLLRHGAAKVYSVDTAYGELAWTLRQDPRVVVMERRNALHTAPVEPVRLVVVDLGWTPQRLLLPAARRWLAPGGQIITLIKPHYELTAENRRAIPRGGVLDETQAEAVLQRVLTEIAAAGLNVRQITRSPIPGRAGKSERGTGNVEWLALVEEAAPGAGCLTAPSP